MGPLVPVLLERPHLVPALVKAGGLFSYEEPEPTNATALKHGFSKNPMLLFAAMTDKLTGEAPSMSILETGYVNTPDVRSKIL